MSGLVSALDNALAGYGEDVILRRVVGSGSAVANIDVTCKARVNAATVQQLVAGIVATELNVIISPTQINNAQWPGGQVPLLPPFDVDQRIPRISVDKMIVRNSLRSVTFVDAKIINGELVRIDLRVSG
jgi:hypothetical protein